MEKNLIATVVRFKLRLCNFVRQRTCMLFISHIVSVAGETAYDILPPESLPWSF